MANDNIDWSGHSAPVISKKHIPQPPSKIAALGSVAICPIQDDGWKPGRRVSEQKMLATPSILGGPVPEKDPSVVGSSNWQTEAQAASTQTKTTREFVSGKKSTIPAHELARPFDESVGARLRDENPYSLNDKLSAKEENEENGHPNTAAEAGTVRYSLVGYRSGGGARSFLEGLGTDVAASLC